MTESEWLASEDPVAMLVYYQSRFIVPNTEMGRKLRLFACACVRQVWHLLTDDARCPTCGGRGGPLDAGGRLEGVLCAGCKGTGRVNRSRRAAEVEELFADGEASVSEMNRAFDAALAVPPFVSASTDITEAVAAAFAAAEIGLVNRQFLSSVSRAGVSPAMQAALLREIVGNPYRPVTLPPGPAVTCGVCAGHRGHIRLMDERHNPPPSPACAMSYEDYLAGRGEGWRRETDTQWWPCPSCKEKGVMPGGCPWLTPDVLALAQAAYDERLIGCRLCKGVGHIDRPVICGPDTSEEEMRRLADEAGGPIPCPSCRGGKRIGTLDPERLAVLSDALEEAGCDDEAILRHLRGEYRNPKCAGDKRGPVHDGPCWLPLPGPHYRGCWALDLTLGRV